MGSNKIEPITPSQQYNNFKKLDYYQLYAIIKKKRIEYKPSTKRKCLEILGNYYGWNRKVDVIT